MEEYSTLWEVIKFLLQYIFPVKKIMDMFSQKNLLIEIGGPIGITGIILIIANKIKKIYKEYKKNNPCQIKIDCASSKYSLAQSIFILLFCFAYFSFKCPF